MSNRLRENIQNRKLVQQHYSKKDVRRHPPRSNRLISYLGL